MNPAYLIAAAEAMSAGTPVGDGYLYQETAGRRSGTRTCGCGRIISANKDACAACAGVTDHPTARRMARAMARRGK